jgi:hypothetical protein
MVKVGDNYADKRLEGARLLVCHFFVGDTCRPTDRVNSLVGSHYAIQQAEKRPQQYAAGPCESRVAYAHTLVLEDRPTFEPCNTLERGSGNEFPYATKCTQWFSQFPRCG